MIGVLALQGAFREHIECLKAVTSFGVMEVRSPEDLAQCSALVIPGGESTAISLAAERTGLMQPLLDFVADESHAIWGTCAGLIFLSSHLRNGKPDQKVLGGLNIEVTRNAYGRQLASFTTTLDFSAFAPNLTDFPAVFIRAPVVSRVLSPGEGPSPDPDVISTKCATPGQADILYVLDDLVVAVRQGNRLGTSFHPELANDTRFHRWFVEEFVKPECL